MKSDNRTFQTQIFLQELKLLCMEYNKSLEYEDLNGSFIVTDYSEDNILWLMSAMERIQVPKRS
jgi:hypothetical protein